MRCKRLPAVLALLLALSACAPAPAEPTPTPSAPPSAPVPETTAPAPEPTPPAEGPVWGEKVYAMDYTDDDGTVLLTVSYTLPYLENAGDYPPYRAVNAYFDGVEDDLVSSAQERAEQARADYEFSAQTGVGFTPGSEDMSYSFTRQTGRYVSLTRTFYVTTEGAAHPTAFLWSEQLDLTSGEKLSFAGCFTDPEQAAERAVKAVLASTQAAALEAEGVSAGTLEASFQPDHFYLSDKGFVFWYQSGELGANNSPVEIAVSYRTFDGIIKTWVQS